MQMRGLWLFVIIRELFVASFLFGCAPFSISVLIEALKIYIYDVSYSEFPWRQPKYDKFLSKLWAFLIVINI